VFTISVRPTLWIRCKTRLDDAKPVGPTTSKRTAS
jgi:hypothetical protein